MEHHKRRTVRDPRLRRAQILQGAMERFTHYGYEATSMRDIAREQDISLGLCYRYFDNKEQLFEEAMKHYVQECLQQFLIIFNNHLLTTSDKFQQLFQEMKSEEEVLPYHDFFHQPQNKRLHEELGLRICEAIKPYMKEELKRYEIEQHGHFQNLDTLITFISYAQIGLLAEHDVKEETLQAIQRYIWTLLEKECIPE